MAATQTERSFCASARPDGAVRNATLLDLPELARIIGAARPGSPRITLGDLEAWLSHGHLLVLDCGGMLGAVVHVLLDHGHAHMDLLIVDEALAGRDLERRMSGVAHALCEAYGCPEVDVP